MQKDRIYLTAYFILVSISVTHGVQFPRSGPSVFAVIVALWGIFIGYYLVYSTRSSPIIGLLLVLTFPVYLRLFYRRDGVLASPDIHHSIETVGNFAASNGIPASALTEGDYPLSYIFGTVVVDVIGVPVSTVVAWTGIFVSVGFLAFVFLLCRSLFDWRAGLLAVVMTGVAQQFVHFHSSFTKETLAIVFFGALIYSLFRTIHSANTANKWRVLVLFFMLAITFSHHLVMAITFLYIGVYWLSYTFLESESSNSELERFTLISFVGFVGYWIYQEISPIQLIVGQIHFLAQSLQNPRYGTIESVERVQQSLPTPYEQLRAVGRITSYLLGVFAGIITLVSLRANTKKVSERVAIAVSGAILGIFTIAFTVIPTGFGTAWGGRFLTYGLAILAIGAAGPVLWTRSHRIARPVIVAAVFGVILLSSFGTPPSLYASADSPRALDGAPHYEFAEEEATTRWAATYVDTSNQIFIDIGLRGRSIRYHPEFRANLRIRAECAAWSEILVSSVSAAPLDCDSSSVDKLYDSGMGKVLRDK